MDCFADINVSRGSVATYARCGGIFNTRLSTNLQRNLPVNFFKSAKIWQNYGYEFAAPLFWPTLYIGTCRTCRVDVKWQLYRSVCGLVKWRAVVAVCSCWATTTRGCTTWQQPVTISATPTSLGARCVAPTPTACASTRQTPSSSPSVHTYT